MAEERAARAGRLRRRKAPWTEQRPWLWEEVQALLRTKKWSPEQIAHRCRQGAPRPARVVGVARGHLPGGLRPGQGRAAQGAHRLPALGPGSATSSFSSLLWTKRDPRDGQHLRTPPGGRRPGRPGHWEGDLMIGEGGASAVATLVERPPAWACSSSSRTAPPSTRRQWRRTSCVYQSTWPSPSLGIRGSRWPRTRRSESPPASPSTSATPIRAWQRGSNENWNGLVRQFLPKGTDLSVHSQEDLDAIAALLNERPRKTLEWETPGERFNRLSRPPLESAGGVRFWAGPR